MGGFVGPDSAISVAGTSVPLLTSRNPDGLSLESLSQSAVASGTVLSKESVQGKGKAGVLINRKMKNANIYQWTLGIQTDTSIEIVIGSYQNPADSPLVKRMVYSAQITPSLADPFDGLKYKFTVEAPLSRLNRVATAVIAATDDKPGSIPHFSLGQVVRGTAPRVTVQNASQFFQSVYARSNPNNFKIESVRPEKILGLEGVEIVAVEKSRPKDNKAVHVILNDDTSWIMLDGVCATDQASLFLPKFKKMAQSLRLK